MNIEIIPHYHLIIKEEDIQYRFYVYIRDDVYYKDDSVYTDHSEALYKGQLYLRQQYELGKLSLYGE